MAAETHGLNGKDPAPSVAARIARTNFQADATALRQDVRRLWRDMRNLFRSTRRVVGSEAQRTRASVQTAAVRTGDAVGWARRTLDRRPALIIGGAIGAGVLLGLLASARSR